MARLFVDWWRNGGVSDEISRIFRKFARKFAQQNLENHS